MKELGRVDRHLGEFWVDNPFAIAGQGENLSAYETNCAYLNLGDLKFINVSYASQVDLDSDSRSIIPIDFDGDGRQDILLANVGGGPLRLFKNQVAGGKSITIDLKGVQSNSRGIGSKVRLTVNGKTIYREVFPVNGFFGAAPSTIVVGIGDASSAEKVEIEWPSGTIDQLTDVAAGKIVVKEGDHASKK